MFNIFNQATMAEDQELKDIWGGDSDEWQKFGTQYLAAMWDGIFPLKSLDAAYQDK